MAQTALIKKSATLSKAYPENVGNPGERLVKQEFMYEMTVIEK